MPRCSTRPGSNSAPAGDVAGDPLRFAEDVIAAAIWSWQRNLLRSIGADAETAVHVRPFYFTSPHTAARRP
ncbi:hypothetical protein GCM10009679_20380 [Saccharothrix algeriensis]|uniref:Uncharacterized protein n=1 Tax=Catellatospora bangladeshensis TaxID=310355 RepID=A0A8J3NI53_9ACTN|nr:hypothetical protein Cba03nite_34390 [Catellatospora bangladeshensis]